MTEPPSGDFRAPHLRHADFLGAFAVVERDGALLMVQNVRRIDGRDVATWDLPGGQVEPGELLLEALSRELREETGLQVVGEPRFLFVQEGERTTGGQRNHAWRSFFFATSAVGEPAAASEVEALCWMPRRDLHAVLTAPYHDSFRRWLADGGSFHLSGWRD